MVGKKIILAVTGSIAAYKAAHLVRLLVKNGAEVQVLMTPSATEFITPLTLSTLSKKPVFTQVIAEHEWNSHVELGLWADALVVAPATANSLAKLANGICDNIVSAVYLSARCPVFLAPAMDLDMWKHPSTQGNVQRLKSYGNHFLPVGYGELASGLVGEGRMAEPEEIATFLAAFFQKKQAFLGKKVLITAGPTYEAIDPVRFIGNRSSGKMGVAIAEQFAERGAEVTLVLGPSKLNPQHPNVTTVKVESAQQMYEASVKHFEKMDIAVLSAAVADYRPANVAEQKIKKKGEGMTIELEKTPDIAASLGKMKRKGQFIVGFALETNNELKNASEKLMKKNFDFIVLNSLQDAGAGFNFDTNKITILHRDNKRKDFELKTKAEVAVDIVDEVLAVL
ncbi:MAG: bifunctional phosphopantothenoylcysteine decarboxylase/phosphopantothenate--cysteine ligase CoaBC [Saprospiraceae bacterium]|nr:bifunctional phosphopantothenoylcysteine decarboxylase/phosphopantothenate--cysteine ligase CoaBC [Saprospiraceae bacterium]MCF8251862.1 bifunctional phosphopantothenoylcysteine decarboxylase/phosphopantothenate--cysteine ligase CoaBC [Saprospiraceae bacterium]MCF8283081.1 bifunctional phosphopantothenoylcysteine decarboxylase/phosphopantothenate--cysteine ligase CoaBC [Bacteroidales bacterium]MCF8313539.1 bifunctional phosphopantothenoylcysteine decarboxylase/phosphopantothenate--cysteine li